MVFLDRYGVGVRLVEQLRRRGLDVVSVTAGEEFAKNSDVDYTISLRERRDYDHVLEELKRLNISPDKIVHLWSVDVSQHMSAEDSLRISFYSLLWLLQAIAEILPTRKIELGIVSNHMQEVTGREKLVPEAATLLGPCKVGAREHPNVVCRSIDLAIDDRSPQVGEDLVNRLVIELSGESIDKIVAYRGNHRWVQLFQPIRLEAPPEKVIKLRQAGTYLIAGGLGGMGLELAEFLARTVQARLVLTGRSPFPAAAEWEAWLMSHSQDDPIGLKIKKLKHLQELGAELLVFRSDLTDIEQMRVVLETATGRFGPINGVIHAAGIAGGGLIQAKTEQMAADVLAAKVKGTRVLEALFKYHQLDFTVLCSSLNSILGGLGQVDYCAANAFLDAFASYNAAENETFTVSVNWDAWTEVGMAARANSSPSKRQHEHIPEETVEKTLSESWSRKESGSRIVANKMSPGQHWMIREHTLGGRPLMPGTGYLELVRKAFDGLAEVSAMEIGDVVFITPMWFGEGEERDVAVVIEHKHDHSSFTIKSSTVFTDMVPAEWVEHASGRVRYNKPRSPKRYDIREIVNRCSVKEVEFFEGESGPRPRPGGPDTRARSARHRRAQRATGSRTPRQPDSGLRRAPSSQG